MYKDTLLRYKNKGWKLRDRDYLQQDFFCYNEK